MSRPSTALVLSGGGARGAYQAGVLKGLLQLGVLGKGACPFDVLVGTSAGSINSTTLAAYADNIEDGISELVQVWSRLQPRQVFRTDLRSVAQTALQWIRDLSFGGLLGNVKPKALLNTEPLAQTLQRLPIERIQGHIDSGQLRALAVAATNYYTSNGVIFLQGRPDLPLWDRARYEVERARISLRHLLASSAIPVFFPSVEIDGRHFGDGCIRNTAPLSPAIQLGAQKIVAVGVRESLATQTRHDPVWRQGAPTMATIAGVLLDAVMIDAIEADIDHCARINRSVARDAKTAQPAEVQVGARESSAATFPNRRFRRGGFRHVDVLWLRPSVSFAAMASRLERRIPILVRYLLRGLGDDQASSELASYLLFDSIFCNQLIDQGVADVLAQASEIREFFSDIT